MELKDLRPNARNPRKITDEKLKMLKKSLDQSISRRAGRRVRLRSFELLFLDELRQTDPQAGNSLGMQLRNSSFGYSQNFANFFQI